MKKSITSLFFIFSISLVLFSQEENTSAISTQHQIGFNMGTLVKALTNKEDLSMFQETFIYKYVKDGSALRVGLGGAYIVEVSDENNNANFNQNNISVRLGFEKQKNVSNKWQYYYGWDLKFSSFSQNNPDIFNDVSKVKSKTFSVSPLLGFQLRITPHLSLQTEASVNFYYTESNFTNLEDIFFPSQFVSPSNKTKIKGVNITLPNILNFVVEF